MRNTTFTDVSAVHGLCMRCAWVVPLLFGMVFALLTPTPAQAQQVSPGCYQRTYTDAHLRSHPDQVVRSVRLWVGQWMTEVAREGMIEVVPANQGHARGEPWVGARLQQFLICGNEANSPRCQAECGAGSLEVREQGASGMLFRTRDLLVGTTGECGGVMDMAEIPGQWVSYRLNRVPDSACYGM